MNYLVQLTDEWLPLPVTLLAKLGWKEADRINIEYVPGLDATDQPILIIAKKVSKLSGL